MQLLSIAGSGKPVPFERGERGAWAALIALTAFAALLRAIGLDGGLWLDEIITLVESVRHPLTQIVTVFPGNNQHTLYSVLAHGSIALFGERPWSLRLPALLFGAATPAALYLFARECTGRGEAMLASILVAVGYHFVWFSQNARGYSALAFFAVLSSWLLRRGQQRGRRGDFAAYAVACALGAYTHLTMVFVAAGHAAAYLVRLGPPWRHEGLARWRLPLAGFTLAAVLSIALYAPLLLDVEQFFAKRAMPPPVATPEWAAKALLSGLELGLGTALGAAAGALLLAVGLWSYLRQDRFLAALFVLPGVFTLATVVALRQPIFPRFLFFLAPFAVLVVVRGAIVIGARLSRASIAHAPAPLTPLGFALVIAMIAASAASLPYDYRYPKQDYAGALAFIDARRAPNEPVAAAGGAIYPLREYYGRSWPEVRSADELATLRASGGRTWVVYTLAEYIAAEAPALMRTLRDDCTVEAVFHGTVAGGDITVCAIPASKRGVGKAT